ncbi:WG repeat-containing protein [Flavobacterium pectinovorum]|uniref:WG repeat-containing protein n=2 Tax=Flavobacterium pectinovorum TaxID=29533 RepID=A0A502E839_9FLAO|nr:WG repeat-containing protein [Flavobacterium pectinovorum]
MAACNKINTDSPKLYIRIMGENSWGYNDEKGNSIIPLGKYKFLNLIDEKGMIYAQKGTKYGYIDIHENIVIPFEYDALGIFSEELAFAKKNNKYGYINRNGEIIIPTQFDNESYFQKTGLALVKKRNLQGFINKKGKEIIPIIYQNAHNTTFDSLVILCKNQKWAFYDSFGKQKTDFIYDEIALTDINLKGIEGDTFWKNGLILVRKNDQTGYLDKNLKEAIPFGKYDSGEKFNQNRIAIISKNHKYGIINEFGKEILKPEYDTLEHPEEDYHESEIFEGKNKNYITLLDKHGNKIYDKIKGYTFDFSRLGNTVKRVYIIRNLKNQCGVVDGEGKVIIPFIYDEIQDFNGTVNTIVKLKKKFGLVNSDNKIVYPIECESITTWKDLDYYIINKNNTVGIIDKNLKSILKFDYQDLSPCFYDKNRFIAKKDNKYGVIDRLGRTIIPFEYSEMSNWVEYGPGSNYHFVIKNNKNGLITKEGKIVIPAIYDSLFYNDDNTIILSKNGKYGVVTIHNKNVIPFEYEKIYSDLAFVPDRNANEFYVLKNGKYFIVDNKNKIIKANLSKKEVEDKFSYLN